MLDNTTILVIASLIVALTTAIIFLTTEAATPIGPNSKPAWRNLWDPVSTGDPDTGSIGLSFAALVVGLGIATPWVSTTALPFGAPDNLVGGVLASAALLKFVAMARDVHRLYAFAVFSEMVVWLALSWSGLVNRPEGAAWLIYGSLTLGELWVLGRLFVDDSRLKIRVEREARNSVAC